MLKKMLASILIAFVLILTPVAANDLVVSNEVNTIATVNPGTSLQGSFRITNTGASALTNVAISVLNPLTGPAGTISASQISLQPNLVSTLASGASQPIGFTINIPSGQAPGLYVGTIEVSDGGSNSVPVSLEITVASKPGINVVESNVVMTGQSDDTVTKDIQVENTGNAPLSSLSFTHNINLSDSDGDFITVTFSPQFTSLNPGQKGTVRIDADIGQDVDLDSYSGVVTVTSGSLSDTFNLDIRVQPEVCSDGPVGHLDIDVKDPDNGDDFAPGDTMNIKVRVDNNDNEDHDITVTAFLYNIDQDDNLEEVDSDEVNINDKDDDTFDFDLEIPTDPDVVSEDDNYVLFVKAYEDGNEDEECEQDEIDIEIKREKDDVRIQDTSVSPSTVMCGESAEFSVDVENVGSNNQKDVYVELKESELSIDERSDEFDLDDGDSGSDSEARKRFTVRIPDDARAKSYLVEASVTYNDGDESASEFITLDVTCDDSANNGGNDDDDGTTLPPETVSIEVADAQITTSGNTFSIPVKVTNNDNTRQTLRVTLDNLEDWASPVSEKVITLNPNQGSTIYFYVTADEDVAGRQSATVNVKDASDDVVASETLSVNLGEEATTGGEGSNFFGSVGSFIKDNSTVFWIIGNLVLIVLVVLFLKVLFTKRKN